MIGNNFLMKTPMKNHNDSSIIISHDRLHKKKLYVLEILVMRKYLTLQR